MNTDNDNDVNDDDDANDDDDDDDANDANWVARACKVDRFEINWKAPLVPRRDLRRRGACLEGRWLSTSTIITLLGVKKVGHKSEGADQGYISIDRLA